MRACISVRLAAALASLTLLQRPAAAGNDSQDAAVPFSLPAFLHQITDTGGFRSKLEQEGVRLTFSYYGDAFANPIGGVKQGFGYDGRFGTIIDGDLQKLVGWSGATFHASIHQIHGTQFSAANLDNLMLVSGIEAPTSTRLFNLWIEQQFANRVNVRVGQFTAAQEFMVSDNADLFVNSTFGWPLLTAVDLPSGGPNYPEATPGARLQIAVTDHLTFRGAIFDGNPAGPGTGNPVFRDPYGLAFRVSDPPFFIAEFEYEHGQAGPGAAAVDRNQEGDFASARARATASGSTLPGTMILGAWINTGAFPDQRFNTQGALLAVAGVRRFCIRATMRSTAWSTRCCGAFPARATGRSTSSCAAWPRPAIAVRSTSTPMVASPSKAWSNGGRMTSRASVSPSDVALPGQPPSTAISRRR